MGKLDEIINIKSEKEYTFIYREAMVVGFIGTPIIGRLYIFEETKSQFRKMLPSVHSARDISKQQFILVDYTPNQEYVHVLVSRSSPRRCKFQLELAHRESLEFLLGDSTILQEAKDINESLGLFGTNLDNYYVDLGHFTYISGVLPEDTIFEINSDEDTKLAFRYILDKQSQKPTETYLINFRLNCDITHTISPLFIYCPDHNFYRLLIRFSINHVLNSRSTIEYLLNYTDSIRFYKEFHIVCDEFLNHVVAWIKFGTRNSVYIKLPGNSGIEWIKLRDLLEQRTKPAHIATLRKLYKGTPNEKTYNEAIDWLESRE